MALIDSLITMQTRIPELTHNFNFRRTTTKKHNVKNNENTYPHKNNRMHITTPKNFLCFNKERKI